MHTKIKKPLILVLLFIAAFLCGTKVEAERVYLDITSADLRKLPIAVPSFADKSNPNAITQQGSDMANLLGKALSFHGFISIIPPESYNNDRNTDWQKIGADFSIVGLYESNSDGVVLELRFVDAQNNRMVLGKRYRTTWNNYSKQLRKFCDEIILQLTGEKGISNTQIAYVSDENGHKEVYVADILGENSRQVTRHKSITVSPRFSPDGKRLAYTSYHRSNPNLYITDLSQSKTTKAISWHNGLNIAPAWSPDGKTMITTLSKDGNPDLYQMAPNGTILNRLTSNEGINVSASWSPDGKQFAFVSDRAGTPQIYVMDTADNRTRRLTYEGKENTTPSWSPKGDLIAYTGRENGNHHLYTISPAGGSPTKLTEYWGNYESPSWSPDGKQIVFSRTRNDQQQLCTIFLDGKGVIPLFNLKGNQTFPQWSSRLAY